MKFSQSKVLLLLHFERIETLFKILLDDGWIYKLNENVGNKDDISDRFSPASMNEKVAVAVVASLVSRLTCYFPEASGLEKLASIAPKIEKTHTFYICDISQRRGTNFKTETSNFPKCKEKTSLKCNLWQKPTTGSRGAALNKLQKSQTRKKTFLATHYCITAYLSS